MMNGPSYVRRSMASEATTAKYATELINRYLENYQKTYGRRPVEFNRNTLKWGFRDMATDLGKARALEIIDVYFELPRAPHKADQMLYAYEKLDQQMEELAEDEKRREKIRQETQERLKEWQSRNLK